MNVICDTCKLTLTVRDQDRGRTHTCPVCRGVLREESVKAPPTETPIMWPGRDLSEAIALVNGAALSVILDVEAPQGRGEVQLIAGGIHRSTCSHNGKPLTGEEALTVMSSWRPEISIRSRLPSAAGELDQAGPDTGDLAERPLAAVMRYCEDFVLTCAVVAWRGNETAHVYYRRGAIERTLVNGVDDAARLPEVMAWKAGRYRILLPKLELPEAVPEAAPAPEAGVGTTLTGMQTQPQVEPPAGVTQPQIVAEAAKPAPPAEFSPAKLPHRPAMTIIGMPAVVVPPAGAAAAAAPPAAARPAAAAPPADVGTTLPLVTQERPAVEGQRSMPIEIMDAPVAPRPSSPAIPAAPAAAPPAAAPESAAGRTTQRAVVKMAEEPKPAAPTPAAAAPAAAPQPAAPAVVEAPKPAAPKPAAVVEAPKAAPPAAKAPAPAAKAPPPAVVERPAAAKPAAPAVVERPSPAAAPAAPARGEEERVTAARRGEPPAPKKRPWVVPLFIVAFVAVAVAAFFIARMIWPATPPTPPAP